MSMLLLCTEHTLIPLDQVGDNSWDVLLLNTMAPGTDWTGTYQRVKGVAEKSVVIMMTTSLGEEDLRGALRRGRFVTLHRPTYGEKLLQLIKGKNDGLLILLQR